MLNEEKENRERNKAIKRAERAGGRVRAIAVSNATIERDMRIKGCETDIPRFPRVARRMYKIIFSRGCEITITHPSGVLRHDTRRDKL